MRKGSLSRLLVPANYFEGIDVKTSHEKYGAAGAKMSTEIWRIVKETAGTACAINRTNHPEL